MMEDVEEARASRMDEWIVWEAEEGIAPRAHNCLPLSFVLTHFYFFCKGDSYSETCTQRTLGAEDFLCCS
jgi:hypothetical protein